MAGLIEQFTVDLTRHAEALGPKVDLFVKGFTQTLFNEVQSGGRYSPGTPVDTGFHRASWAGGIGETPRAAVEGVAPRQGPGAHNADVAAAAAQLQEAALRARAGDVIVLANNAPAIRRLEHGWSKQAPAGMVGLALQAGQQIADEVAAHVLGTP